LSGVGSLRFATRTPLDATARRSIKQSYPHLPTLSPTHAGQRVDDESAFHTGRPRRETSLNLCVCLGTHSDFRAERHSVWDSIKIVSARTVPNRFQHSTISSCLQPKTREYDAQSFGNVCSSCDCDEITVEIKSDISRLRVGAEKDNKFLKRNYSRGEVEKQRRILFPTLKPRGRAFRIPRSDPTLLENVMAPTI
jgi:hypothetical protein